MAETKRILVVGSGGREHALAWCAARSPSVEKVFVAPGNAGTAREAGCENVDIDVGDFEGLAAFAVDQGVALTIIGPEAPLVDGICDFFAERGLRCFGPSGNAAQLEGSKSFSKDFLARHKIPTAEYQTFEDLASAKAYVVEKGAPIVIKADGLAAGKGVVVAGTEAEANAALNSMLSGGAFGQAGERVVIEEFLDGEEASFICLCDGAVEHHSAPDAVVITSDIIAVLFDDRKFAFEPLIIEMADIAGVRKLRHEFKRHPFTFSADQQRNVRLLHSFRLVNCAMHPVIFTSA